MCMLETLNHIHICQVSPQLSCSDTCQIGTWCYIGKQCFDNLENLGNGTSKIGLVTPPVVCYGWIILVFMACFIKSYSFSLYWNNYFCKRWNFDNIDSVWMSSTHHKISVVFWWLSVLWCTIKYASLKMIVNSTYSCVSSWMCDCEIRHHDDNLKSIWIYSETSLMFFDCWTYCMISKFDNWGQLFLTMDILWQIS